MKADVMSPAATRHNGDGLSAPPQLRQRHSYCLPRNSQSAAAAASAAARTPRHLPVAAAVALTAEGSLLLSAAAPTASSSCRAAAGTLEVLPSASTQQPQQSQQQQAGIGNRQGEPAVAAEAGWRTAGADMNCNPWPLPNQQPQPGGGGVGTPGGGGGGGARPQEAPIAKWPAMMNLAGVANGEVVPGQLASCLTGDREDSGADSSTGSFCSPDGHSGQKSPHKEVSPKMNKSRNEKFHKLFKIIPGDEVVLNAYSCAYFGDILLQGNLYISPNWFCFHSRILGHEKLIEIHVTKVVNVTREKTAFIIPNAIGIRTADDKFVFGSLMSRDSTYKLMVNVWKQARAGEMLDITKDTGDEDVSDNNGCIDDPSNENNNEVLKALPAGVVDVSEVSSDTESDADPCIPEHTPMPRAVNYHSADEQRGREKKVKDYIPYSILGGPISAASQFVSKASSMPRTSLLLAVCGILVLVLMLSAVVMTYKIMVLQARLDSNPGWSESPKSSVSGDTLYRDVYFLNNQYHTATVERFHSVVRANIELLGQVHNSLKSLQSSPLAQDKSCLKDEDVGSRTDDTKIGDT